MKLNRLSTQLFSMFLGIISVVNTSTTSAGSISDEIVNALEALVPEARERLITSCREITKPGAYSLIRNLSSTGDCLIVNADHVTIDLNGFVISGPGGDYRREGVGISGDIQHGLHVKNGTITEFGVAIGASPRYSSLDEMSIISNDAGANLGDGARIKNTIFAHIFGPLAEEGLALRTGNGATIKDNTFYQNYSHLVVGSGSLVINNIGINANQFSFLIGEEALVIGNNVTDTHVEGVVGSNSNVINNNVFSNDASSSLDIYVKGESNVHGNFAGKYRGGNFWM